MCTVITALDVWSDAPLVVAANRDERLARPSEGPALRDWGPLPIVAPRDAVAGGTWWGLNGAGLFVAITNRFGSPPEPTLRSRGLLVVDALRESSVEDAVRRALVFGARAHNPFHLLIAAGRGTPAAGGRPRAELVWDDGAQLRHRVLEPGLHVLTERSLGAGDGAREQTVRRVMNGAVVNGALYPGDAVLQRVLSTTTDDPWSSVMVRVPDLGYGTRSQTLALLGSNSRVRHADGPPPDTRWEDVAVPRTA